MRSQTCTAIAFRQHSKIYYRLSSPAKLLDIADFQHMGEHHELNVGSTCVFHEICMQAITASMALRNDYFPQMYQHFSPPIACQQARSPWLRPD